MSRDQLDTLFKEYEIAFDQLDLKTISGYCADNFISAGPRGSIAQSRRECEKEVEHTIQYYRSIGRKSAKIISKRIMPICNDYSMVIIRWGITFEKTGTRQIEFDISYVIQQTGIDPRIILFISHDDEEATIKKLDLQKK